MITRIGNRLRMPGMASAHSHAFQRALRGRTQRRATQSGNFWSWRDQMFRIVERLTPEHVFNISRFAFIELALQGVTAIGEFHYVHHGPAGQPYANRLETSESVIEAARQAGLRLCLIRTGYYRGGHTQLLSDGQRRFCDHDVDETLRDVDVLRARASGNPLLNIAIAAHSIRACTHDQIAACAGYAKAHGLMFHMHVSEQRRELQECVAEHGLLPVEFLAANGWLSPTFVATHATHLNRGEIAQLGASGAMVCMCRSTERDLGDGLPLSAELLQHGVRLCVGVDSHASSDAFDEVRAVELDDRVRHEQRIVAAEAPQLLEIATRNGYAALGLDAAVCDDWVELNANDPSIAAIDDQRLTDAVIFGANARAVRTVCVGGRQIVIDGRHAGYDVALDAYAHSLRQMELL